MWWRLCSHVTIFTTQTVMLGRIPPGIHHGGAWNVASHGMSVTSLRFSVVLNSCNHFCCKFTSVGEIWSRGVQSKVRYQSRIFLRDAGWKVCRQNRWSFPPSINSLFHTLKTRLFVHFEGWGSATNLFMDFTLLSTYTKISQSHSPIINGWVEFLA